MHCSDALSGSTGQTCVLRGPKHCSSAINDDDRIIATIADLANIPGECEYPDASQSDFMGPFDMDLGSFLTTGGRRICLKYMGRRMSITWRSSKESIPF